MKPDNIYRTLVSMVPDLDSKHVWEIWQYIHDLIDDAMNEARECEERE